MFVRVKTEEGSKLIEIENRFAQEIIDGVSSIALTEIDKIPMARSSIKAILRTAMMFYKVKNPNPKVNDIDFVLGMMKEKAVEFIESNIIEVDGVIHHED